MKAAFLAQPLICLEVVLRSDAGAALRLLSAASAAEMALVPVVLGAKGERGLPGAGVDNFSGDPLAHFILALN